MNTSQSKTARSPKKSTPTDAPVPTLPATLLQVADGQSRVVIANVSPELNRGRFPIKAVPGNVVAVEADIFLDGHDFIAARLLYKHDDDEAWTETTMALLGNDHWGASFIVDKQGRYVYTLEAWVDHLASWQHEVHLKVADGQRITSELLAGAQYVEGMLERAGGKEKEGEESPDVMALREMAALFRAGGEGTDRYDEAVSVAESDQFTFYANRYPERQHVTRYGAELVVEVDRAIAGFSTWYCLFPRSAARQEGRHGTFRDVEALLPRIAGMGFDVLYLPPIHPIGTAHRKGKNNSVVCQPGRAGRSLRYWLN